MMGWLDSLSDDDRNLLTSVDMPEWLEPMLATLAHEPFSDADWIYERKLDGQRLLAYRDSGGVDLFSRNRKRNSSRYPEVREALEHASPSEFIVDGEVVAFEGAVSSFSKLQPRMQLDDEEAARASDVRVFYYVFDVLYLEGLDLTDLPLRTRKSILRSAFAFEDPLRYAAHRNEHGETFLEEACAKHWEGLIAKRADSTYKHSRSRDWLKFKCTAQQELVIGGFTDPKGSRVGFGALLLGYYEEGSLRYAGKVGTGFDEDALLRLRDRLDRLERKTAAFEADDLPSSGVHWVTPQLVAEVAFTEWTPDGKLRHPRYLGLRFDKEAADVVRERPAS